MFFKILQTDDWEISIICDNFRVDTEGSSIWISCIANAFSSLTTVHGGPELGKFFTVPLFRNFAPSLSMALIIGTRARG